MSDEWHIATQFYTRLDQNGQPLEVLEFFYDHNNAGVSVLRITPVNPANQITEISFVTRGSAIGQTMRAQNVPGAPVPSDEVQPQT